MSDSNQRSAIATKAYQSEYGEEKKRDLKYISFFVTTS